MDLLTFISILLTITPFYVLIFRCASYVSGKIDLLESILLSPNRVTVAPRSASTINTINNINTNNESDENDDQYLSRIGVSDKWQQSHASAAFGLNLLLGLLRDV